MRIAIYHNLPSGGAKRTLCESARRLALRHQVDVYTLSSADHGFADLRPHVANHRVYDFQSRPLLDSPWGRLNQGLRLTDLARLRLLSRTVAQDMRAGSYDVAFIHACQFEKAPSVLAYLGDLPSIYYCQEPLRVLYEQQPPRPYDDSSSRRRMALNRVDPLLRLYLETVRRVDQGNTRRATRVLVNSQYMRQTVGRIYRISPQLSYHGIDSERFAPLALEKEPFLLSVGSLTPLKGFDFLVEALAELPADQRLPLVLASNFQNLPERAFLEQLAQQKQVELRFLGHVSDAQLVELYNRALLTVYAPLREPFGLVPLESMACATPVVAVGEGGTAETILHEQTGLLVERDTRRFAAAVERLLANPGLAAAYGQAGRQQVEQHWTWAKATQTVEQHLLAMVHSRAVDGLPQQTIALNER